MKTKPGSSSLWKIAIVVLVFLSLLILIMGCFYSILTCKKISNITLQEWQQLSNLVYGASGIMLGYLYFKSKIAIDEDYAKKDRIRNRITYIREELIQVDKLIDQILQLQINDKDELTRVRLEIDKRFMLLMNNFIESNSDLIGFEKNELDSIVALNSFVSNSAIISEIDLSLLKNESNRSSERIKYLEKLYEATTMCMLKIENL